MRISLEISEPDRRDGSAQIELYLDAAGRDYLVKELLALDYPSNDHFHVLSPAWSGDGELLTEEKRLPSSLIGRHLKVYIRPNDEKLFAPE